MKDIPSQLLINRNKKVLKYLAPLSCHGDIIQPLEVELKKYTGVERFCPDGSQFRYCLWFVNNTIFAYGAGMTYIGLRLLESDVENSTKNEIGDEWCSIPYNSLKLTSLVRKAYDYAIAYDVVKLM